MPCSAFGIDYTQMLILGAEDVALRLAFIVEADVGSLSARARIGSHDCLFRHMFASCYSSYSLLEVKAGYQGKLWAENLTARAPCSST